MRRIILTAAVVAALALSAGCSMEPGGSDDPEGFQKVQGLEQASAPAEQQQNAVLDALRVRVDALEGENARLSARVDELERSTTERTQAVDQRLDALEARPEPPAPTVGAAPGAPLDLGDDKAFEKKVVRQGLEQIVNMSRLLLDKMEYEMNEKTRDEAFEKEPAGAGDASATAGGAVQ